MNDLLKLHRQQRAEIDAPLIQRRAELERELSEINELLAGSATPVVKRKVTTEVILQLASRKGVIRAADLVAIGVAPAQAGQRLFYMFQSGRLKRVAVGEYSVA